VRRWQAHDVVRPVGIASQQLKPANLKWEINVRGVELSGMQEVGKAQSTPPLPLTSASEQVEKQPLTDTTTDDTREGRT
jgi:hypothetical protein